MLCRVKWFKSIHFCHKQNGEFLKQKYNSKINCPSTFPGTFWQDPRHQTMSSFNDIPCISVTLVHCQWNAFHSRQVVIDLPLGFSIYSLLVSREEGEDVFQKLCSATIDLQLPTDPASLWQICDSHIKCRACRHPHTDFQMTVNYKTIKG